MQYDFPGKYSRIEYFDQVDTASQPNISNAVLSMWTCKAAVTELGARIQGYRKHVLTKKGPSAADFRLYT